MPTNARMPNSQAKGTNLNGMHEWQKPCFSICTFFLHCARYTCIEKHMHTHKYSIHTYVRAYIYIMHRQLLSCDVGIDRFLLSSLIQPWGCTGFMGIPGQAVDVPQLSLGRSHGRWHAPSPKSQHQRYKTSSRYWWFLAFTVILYCKPLL